MGFVRRTSIGLGWRMSLALALLCATAYWPFLDIPLISDDYIQIYLGRTYGPIDSWPRLAQDALYRCRATSILLTHWTEALFGVGTGTLGLTSLAIHFVNCLLVLMTGLWRRIGWPVAIPAACFFAVFQRPQEAVVWYAALPELLVFTFVLSGLLCWLRYLDKPQRRWYAATLACFGLALLSKESGVVLAPLVFATAWVERRRLQPTIPFFLVSAVYFGMAHAAKEQHLHFQDGTFSLTAPFLITEAYTIWRLVWVWGVVAIALLWLARRRHELPWLAAALAWMFIVLLPYSFLTYQNTVPSRHTYLASVGVAFLMGRAFATWRERLPDHRTMLAAVGVLYLISQVVYLWIYKHPQYLERARPTEELIRAVQEYRGPVDVACFPYSVEVAHRAVEISTAGEAWISLADDDAPAGYALSVNQCAVRSN